MYFAYFHSVISYEIISTGDPDYYKGLQEEYPEGEFFDTFSQAKIWLIEQCSGALQDYRLAMQTIKAMRKNV